MSTMLKTVGSTESVPELRESFFKTSEAYAELDQLLNSYTECEGQQKLLLVEAKKLLVQPVRDTLSDCNNVMKKKGAKAKKTKTNHNVENEINQRVLHSATILPHHLAMFEKHRVIYMKGILKSVLTAEMQYHCRAIETLSPLFEQLNLVDENNLEVESFLRAYQTDQTVSTSS